MSHSAAFRWGSGYGLTMRFFFILLVLLVGAVPAKPWGQKGHRAVGLIAERHLTGVAAREVRDLLDAETLAEASTWADEIRSDPAWRVADPWHYINVDDGETLDGVLARGERNVISEIERLRDVLANREVKRRERIEALRFLAHFVGDLHQPLHVGKAADRGGNTQLLTWFKRPSNLHTVWDSSLIESMGLSFTELARWVNHPTWAEVIAWQMSGPRDWARESLELRGRAYEIGSGNLGYEYLREMFPIVKRRLAQSGIRLAGLLNDIFY